jgi:hypothetical protein
MAEVFGYLLDSPTKSRDHIQELLQRAMQNITQYGAEPLEKHENTVDRLRYANKALEAIQVAHCFNIIIFFGQSNSDRTFYPNPYFDLIDNYLKEHENSLLACFNSFPPENKDDQFNWIKSKIKSIFGKTLTMKQGGIYVKNDWVLKRIGKSEKYHFLPVGFDDTPIIPSTVKTWENLTIIREENDKLNEEIKEKYGDNPPTFAGIIPTNKCIRVK